MALVEIDWKPTPKMLRSFGLIAIVGFGVLGALAYWQAFVFGAMSAETGVPTAYVLWGLAAYCGLFGVVAPTVVKPVYLILTVVTFPIGFVFSYVVMGVVYYLVLLPIGLVFKLVGRDAMTRKFDPSAKTYWVTRKPPDSMKRYFRQF